VYRKQDEDSDQKSTKKTANEIIRKTLKDRNKRIGRKRTDSFHFANFSDESPDDTSSESILKLHRTPALKKTNDFSGYKMTTEETPTPEKAEEDLYSFGDFNKSAIKKKKDSPIMKRRKRTKSEDVSQDFSAFSPPKDTTDQARRISNVTPESIPDALKKGGGYKMSMESVPDTEEEEKSPAVTQDDDDDDYFG
jgi:hypothetical protein